MQPREYTLYSDFRADPVGAPLNTPSGKIEIVVERAGERRLLSVTPNAQTRDALARVAAAWRPFRATATGKVIEKANKFKVHDEKNEAKTGDWVELEECRPISRTKSWRLLRIIKRAGQAD